MIQPRQLWLGLAKKQEKMGVFLCLVLVVATMASLEDGPSELHLVEAV